MCAPKAAPAESMAAIIIGRMTDSTPVASAGAAPLNHLGVIRITGADAANFIHNQLTQDFLLLPPQHARLAAFCSAKGRMQASFIGFKPDADTVLLKVVQVGGAACHTGHRSCFHTKIKDGSATVTDLPVFDPREVYRK